MGKACNDTYILQTGKYCDLQCHPDEYLCTLVTCDLYTCTSKLSEFSNS